MRPSLENIAYIENYILGNLDANERESARRRIESSPELRQLLEAQQSIYAAARRKALRAEIQSYAPTSPSFFQQYRYWFLGGLSILAVIVCLIAFNSSKKLTKHTSTEARISTNSVTVERNVTPWIPFDVQYFDLVAEKGGTITGEDGTVVILGGNSLLDAEGKLVTGKVQAELIEAIDWEDMIAYNLTTTSSGKALSSGGMMRIRYRQNGEEVFVDPKKPMHIEIPTDNYNSDMKVWEGEIVDDQLDWKNPQEINRYLKRVDLRYLDFVPKGFDLEVASILPYAGHSSVSNELVDSLYYSISKNRELFSNQEGPSLFSIDCNFNIPVRQDEERRGGKPYHRKPQMQGNNTVTGQIVDTDGNPIAGMDVKLRMDRYLEHVDRITTDADGKFSYSQLYPGEVAIYASLHSQDDAEILWKYCLESSFNCPKNPQNHTLKEPLVAECSRMVNFDLLSVLPRTNGAFIDPLKIKTLKTSRFQNTFIATKEFEQRLQVMHQLTKGSLLLNTYITHLSEPLWKCDQMAAELLYGTERTIFEDFSKERLTNVQNDGIHQEALLQYYSEQCMAFRSENEQILNEYQSKTYEEITAMTKSIEAVLNNPGQLAVSQASHKGWGSAKGSNFSTNRKTTVRRVRTDTYSFSWASSSWCNIDRYLGILGTNPWITEVKTNLNRKNITVYRTIRELKTIIGLEPENGVYNAVSPKSNAYDDVICLAIHRDKDQLLFGGNSFDPTTTRNLDLNLVPVSDEEFYLKLCSLAPSESLIAKEFQADYERLKAHARMDKKNARYNKLLESARNTISEEVILYNRLFVFLNRNNKNLVQ